MRKRANNQNGGEADAEAGSEGQVPHILKSCAGSREILEQEILLTLIPVKCLLDHHLPPACCAICYSLTCIYPQSTLVKLITARCKMGLLYAVRAACHDAMATVSI